MLDLLILLPYPGCAAWAYAAGSTGTSGAGNSDASIAAYGGDACSGAAKNDHITVFNCLN